MKNLVKSKRAEGFTIIEVMIVLAIAGLIMVIVFIAVPQLQRNQRDNARQNIVNRMKAEMETYAGNNQGLYPFASGAGCNATTTGCWLDFTARYINGKVKTADPSTGNATFDDTHGVPANCNNATCTPPAVPNARGNVIVVYGAKCNGEALTWSTGAVGSLTGRTYAIMMGLDRAGTTYCVDNG